MPNPKQQIIITLEGASIDLAEDLYRKLRGIIDEHIEGYGVSFNLALSVVDREYGTPPEEY